MIGYRLVNIWELVRYKLNQIIVNAFITKWGSWNQTALPGWACVYFSILSFELQREPNPAVWLVEQQEFDFILPFSVRHKMHGCKFGLMRGRRWPQRDFNHRHKDWGGDFQIFSQKVQYQLGKSQQIRVVLSYCLWRPGQGVQDSLSPGLKGQTRRA